MCEKERILVVDDDEMNLCMAQRMLQKYFTVNLISTGEEVLPFLSEHECELILLEVHMPGLNGFEVMRRLQENEKYREIPVILFTADNDRSIEVQGFQAGALDFITKPLIADIVIQRVSRILELSRLQKHLKREVERQTQAAEERRRKVERLSMQIMKALVSAIDAKDEYTNGHSLRVAEYSAKLAEKAGMSPGEQEDIYNVGLLHDIGKIGIPDEIITKASGLTDEEYIQIKSHTSIGADILKNISEIPNIETGARWHHERYDGSGYPDGLRGEEIPVFARLIGVADAYDAMTSRRSYRDVLPQAIVREELVKGTGTQFDPYFAKLMIELIDEDVDYRMREI